MCAGHAVTQDISRMCEITHAAFDSQIQQMHYVVCGIVVCVFVCVFECKSFQKDAVAAHACIALKWSTSLLPIWYKLLGLLADVCWTFPSTF